MLLTVLCIVVIGSAESLYDHRYRKYVLYSVEHIV